MSAERVEILEAVRRTGVPGDRIFLAIRHGEISTDLDERLRDHVLLEEVDKLSRDRLDIEAPPPPQPSPDLDPRRVSVVEANRRTGVPGDQILLAIKYGRITTQFDERGRDRVLVDEVLTLRDEAS